MNYPLPESYKQQYQLSAPEYTQVPEVAVFVRRRNSEVSGRENDSKATLIANSGSDATSVSSSIVAIAAACAVATIIGYAIYRKRRRRR